MKIKPFEAPAKWFGKGIPDAFVVAPWQSKDLKTNVLFPDETGTVEYHLNSKGYRDVEWSDDDLNDSIWCVGNSDVFGLGVANEHTWVRVLEKKSGIKTINLGIAGAAWDTIARIVACGLRRYKPRAVIVQTTTPDRREYISNSKQQIVLPSLPASLFSDQTFWKYVDEENSQYCLEKNISLISASCDANDIPSLIFELTDRWDIVKQDPSADKTHYGVDTHHKIAEDIACILNESK